MKKTMLAVMATFLPTALPALDAGAIIRRVDRQARARTSSFTAVMTIRKGSRTLTKQFEGYGMSTDNRFFLRFTNAADRGVKYLRIAGSLWIYFPDADDIMRISGHMLRRGMMGSDISYEDLLQFEHFEKNYAVTLKGSTTIDGRTCHRIVCTAKREGLTYPKQVLYVDTARFVTLRQELYTRSGRKIKIIEKKDVRLIGGRHVPLETTIRDTRRSDSATTVKYNSIRFNIAVPAGTFTRRNLRR